MAAIRSFVSYLVILSLIYDTGARVQEICDLTIESVRVSSKPCSLLLIGKRRKQRIVLRKYMEENRLDGVNKTSHPLFFNTRGEKLTRAGVSYMLKTYAYLARKENPHLISEKLSSHCLKYTNAMHLLQSGVNLVYTRYHRTCLHTDIYACADSKAKREALEKAYINMIPQTASDSEWESNKNLRD